VQHHGDRNRLAPLRIRQPEGGAFGDGGMLAQGRFDFQRMDVLAARDNQVPGPPDHGVAAIGGAAGQVAGVEPARSVAGRLVRPVAGHDVGAAHQQFTRIALHVGQHCLDAGRGPAATAGVAGCGGRRQRDRERTGLGGAVDVAQRHTAIEKGAHQRCRQHAGAGPHRPQAGQVGLRPVRVIDQCLHRGRHLQGQRRPFLRQRRQRRIGAEARVQRDAGAGAQGRQRLDAQAADMEHRQHREHPVLRGDLLHLRCDPHVGQQVGLGVEGGARPAGGAGGVDQQHGGSVFTYLGRGIGRLRRIQRCQRVHRDCAARAKRCCLLAQSRVVHQMRWLAIAQLAIPFSRRQPDVQRQQHGADARQREQQHQLVWMVQPQPGNALAGAHAPAMPQQCGHAGAAIGQLSISQFTALEAQRRRVRPAGGVVLRQLRQALREGQGLLGHLPNFTAATSALAPLWPRWQLPHATAFTIPVCSNY